MNRLLLRWGRAEMSCARRQRGAALVVSLVMLLLLTLLGVAAIRTATLQERMAGAMRDHDIAFQAAEAALRAGEAYLDSLSESYVPDRTSGRYHWSGPQVGNPCEGDASDDLPCKNTVMVSAAGLAKPPQYIIEQLGHIAAAAGTASGDEPGSLASDTDYGLTTVPVFRITARGWGGSKAAVVTLQSTYRP